jgi:hypothetical protein
LNDKNEFSENGIPLEVIHLTLGLGKPSATHSSFNTSPAFARISFGSLIQVRGTEQSFKFYTFDV